jgi:hypothetical protein
VFAPGEGLLPALTTATAGGTGMGCVATPKECFAALAFLPSPAVGLFCISCASRSLLLFQAEAYSSVVWQLDTKPGDHHGNQNAQLRTKTGLCYCYQHKMIIQSHQFEDFVTHRGNMSWNQV